MAAHKIFLKNKVFFSTFICIYIYGFLLKQNKLVNLISKNEQQKKCLLAEKVFK
jgi:hypothetical protein